MNTRNQLLPVLVSVTVAMTSAFGFVSSPVFAKSASKPSHAVTKQKINPLAQVSVTSTVYATSVNAYADIAVNFLNQSINNADSFRVTIQGQKSNAYHTKKEIAKLYKSLQSNYVQNNFCSASIYETAYFGYYNTSKGQYVPKHGSIVGQVSDGCYPKQSDLTFSKDYSYMEGSLTSTNASSFRHYSLVLHDYIVSKGKPTKEFSFFVTDKTPTYNKNPYYIPLWKGNVTNFIDQSLSPTEVFHSTTQLPKYFRSVVYLPKGVIRITSITTLLHTTL